MTLLWPLKDLRPRFPYRPGEDGAFGFVRKHEIHTGVDLYCDEDQPVVAADDGRFVRCVPFTGPEAGSPWWEPTWAMIVDHVWGVVVYGEIHAKNTSALMAITPLLAPGRHIPRGTVLGHVKRVRNPKPCDPRPTTMLHIEMWQDLPSVLACYKDKRATVAADWPLGTPKPDGLLDPTDLLQRAAEVVGVGQVEVEFVVRWHGRYCHRRTGGYNAGDCDFHGQNNEGQICCRFGPQEATIGPHDMVPEPIPLELEGNAALRCQPCIKEYGE